MEHQRLWTNLYYSGLKQVSGTEHQRQAAQVIQLSRMEMQDREREAFGLTILLCQPASLMLGSNLRNLQMSFLSQFLVTWRVCPVWQSQRMFFLMVGLYSAKWIISLLAYSLEGYAPRICSKLPLGLTHRKWQTKWRTVDPWALWWTHFKTPSLKYSSLTLFISYKATHIL